MVQWLFILTSHSLIVLRCEPKCMCLHKHGLPLWYIPYEKLDANVDKNMVYHSSIFPIPENKKQAL